MRIDVLTLFPEAIEPFFSASIIGRAATAGIVSIRCVNYRDFTTDKHRTVDDRPFGGGPGMVLMCPPVFEAVEKVESDATVKPQRVLLTPQGERLTQAIAAEFSREARLTILCGHYEGFDERIRIGLGAREISVGDYVTSSGESAAMVLVDTIVRLLPGALGDSESTVWDSFVNGLLEYPQYTRPRTYREMAVPDVLLSGDHGRIETWRREQAWQRTRSRRPDLIDRGQPDGDASDVDR